MGPANVNTLPTRPRFMWDTKSPPWTDGKGNQEKFKVAVEDWVEFHDSLPGNHTTKIAKGMQGLLLKSQLYGQAADLCSALTKDQLKSNDGVSLIVNKIYQRDALSVISEAYDGFNLLLSTRRNPNENLKNFELRFAASVTKFNSLSDTTKLPQCITALMLLSNSGIDHSQRISVLAAAAPTGNNLTDSSTNDQFLAAVTYKQVASVVKQCNSGSSSTSGETLVGNYGGPTNETNRNGNGNGYNKGKGKFGFKKPPLSVLKRKPCIQCKKFGHWKDSHASDGTLPNGTPAFDTAQKFIESLKHNHGSGASEGGNSNPNGSKNTLTFNNACLTGNSCNHNGNSANRNNCSNDVLGPLVDDGAPYSAIGYIELQLLLNSVNDVEIDPMPSCLENATQWQYGSGEHSSAPRKILGSYVLTLISDNGNEVRIRHLVLDGSSQWVIGKNVTGKCDILHAKQNALSLIHI